MCSCGTGCWWDGVMVEVRDIFHIITRRLCRYESFIINLNGQFIVSRNRLLKVEKALYQDLLDAFDPSLQNPILQNHQFLRYTKYKFSKTLYRGSNDSLISKEWMINPLMAHSMERVWTLLFDCYAMDLVPQCSPCGWECKNHPCQVACELGECQCLDENV